MARELKTHAVTPGDLVTGCGIRVVDKCQAGDTITTKTETIGSSVKVSTMWWGKSYIHDDNKYCANCIRAIG